jgi:hypothetical protein
MTEILSPAERQEAERLFPIHCSGSALPHPTQIPWSVADKAYSVYSARYGKGQSLERLAERGGFNAVEMDEYYPPWRDETSEILNLRAQLTALTQERDALKEQLSKLAIMPNVVRIVPGKPSPYIDDEMEPR